MARHHVLVVEDDRELAEAFTGWLAEPYDTSTAYTGAEALEVVDERGDEIDVVLLDRRLPDRSGDDVLEAIRARDIECRVAIVTAVDPDFDILEMGFDDYLVKPVVEADVVETVERLLAQLTFDEQVRHHLELVAKQELLEAEFDAVELEASDEYARLERDITESRDRLDASVSGDVFVDYLLRVARDDLYAVLEYDAESWGYRYVNDTAESFFAGLDAGLDALVDDFRREGQRNTRLDRELDLDGYYCSLHLFDWIVFMHFYQPDDEGFICGFDPDTAPNLTGFIERLLPYLRAAGLRDIDQEPSWA